MEKKLLFLGVLFTVVALSGSVTLAFDPVGPLGSQLKQGEQSVGLIWGYSDMDVHRYRKAGSDSPKKAELEMHKLLFEVAHGPSDNWDVFGRVGAIVASEFTRGAYEGDLDGDCDVGFTIGGGVRATFARPSPNVIWGGVAQFSWNRVDGDMDPGTSYYEGEPDTNFDLDFIEAQVVAGPTWTVVDSSTCHATVYAGAGYFLLRCVLDEEGPYERPEHRVKAVTEMDSFGGVVGLQALIRENTSVNVEYIWTGDSYGFGAGLIFKTR